MNDPILMLEDGPSVRVGKFTVDENSNLYEMEFYFGENEVKTVVFREDEIESLLATMRVLTQGNSNWK